MAFSVAQMYPGAFDPDADFVDGKYKNSSAPGVYDGTPLDNLLFNQNLSLFDAMMVNAGLTYSNSADTPETSQLFEAMQLSSLAENRFKGNQNPLVEGKEGYPLPSAAPATYSADDEIVAGIIAFTAVDNLTYVNGVYSADSGILRRRYAKDAAGLITKTSQYGGVKLPDGSQLQALVDDIATNGVRITEDGSDVVVDVDLSVVTTGFRFFGLSDERGEWAYANDDESINNQVIISRSVDFAWANVITSSLSTRSFNIDPLSVQKMSTGRYRLFFVRQPSDNRYSITISATGNGLQSAWPTYDSPNKTTEYFEVTFGNMGAGGSTYTAIDPVEFSVSIKWGS